MSNNKEQNKYILFVIIFLIIVYLLSNISNNNSIIPEHILKGDTFKIIASTSTSTMDKEIIKYAKKEGFNVEIDHYGDLEIVDILNDNSSNYNAVWISNSLWLYMLDNSYLTTDSKSIVIDPVVMGIEKSNIIKTY